MITTAYLDSPLGLVALTGSNAGLSAIIFHGTEGQTATALSAAVPACLQEVHRQLQAYFGHELRVFSLTYAPEAGTEFQRQVWQALSGIGFGRTASYLEVAKRLNNPKSVRAVGAANCQNPLAKCQALIKRTMKPV